MPYVLLGQTSAVTDPRLPATVVIPEGTALHYMTSGGRVTIGPGEPGVWGQMQGLQWFRAGQAVSNLALRGVLEDAGECEGQFGDWTLVLPGEDGYDDPLVLCRDTDGSCDPAEGAGATHTCDGVLGLHRGEDLYWMACDEIMYVDRQALLDWHLRTSAEAVLGALLCGRAETGLASALAVHAADFASACVRALLGARPQGVATAFMAVVRRTGPARPTLADVEERVRAVLGEHIRQGLDRAVTSFTARVLRGETQRLLDEGLTAYAGAVAAAARYRGAAGDVAEAEAALREVLAARLGGDREDLVIRDVRALEEDLGTVRDEVLSRVFDDVVTRLAVEFLRRVPRRVVDVEGPADGSPAPAA
ncbi:hypothetical protein ACFQ78_32030 [Streptomyces sp. NPDC056519]|uniref:hypothetical protein n=1 Tax=Streptomyces sp. NPDC056519 TaxID=3345849 RepID=UPI0036868378